MSRAQELAQALASARPEDIASDDKKASHRELNRTCDAINDAQVFLAAIASREEGQTPEDEWYRKSALESQRSGNYAERMLATMALAILDERARDKARIAAALAAVEEWESYDRACFEVASPYAAFARVKEALTK